ncbi:MAG: flagellar motor protein [Capsulimonadaceae bacterium]|nr:flagellar motor protein [Capsulimonadaceae bacterium]
MDLATIIGFFLAWGAFFGSIALEGGDPKAFLNVSAMVLVFGGTFGATIMSFPLDAIMKMPNILKNAVMGKTMDLGKTIQILVTFAERARREGLLALEEQARDIDDEFLKKGVQLAVDGTDPELVRAILETEIAYVEERHSLGASIFSTMGGFAPTLGVIGTVAGLVHMLSNLSDPGSMGPAIASAFIATLMGVSSANLVFLPLSNKLKQRSKVEILLREIMLEGILSIQAGDNPRVVEEKLKAFLDPVARKKVTADAVEAG